MGRTPETSHAKRVEDGNIKYCPPSRTPPTRHSSLGFSRVVWRTPNNNCPRKKTHTNRVCACPFCARTIGAIHHKSGTAFPSIRQGTARACINTRARHTGASPDDLIPQPHGSQSLLRRKENSFPGHQPTSPSSQASPPRLWAARAINQ